MRTVLIVLDKAFDRTKYAFVEGDYSHFSNVFVTDNTLESLKLDFLLATLSTSGDFIDDLPVLVPSDKIAVCGYLR